MSSESKQNIVQISLQFRTLKNDVIEGDSAKLSGGVKYDTSLCCGSFQRESEAGSISLLVFLRLGRSYECSPSPNIE